MLGWLLPFPRGSDDNGVSYRDAPQPEEPGRAQLLWGRSGAGWGVQPHFSAGCRAAHAAPPPPSCPAPLTDTALGPCHAAGGFQAWPMRLPGPAELCASPA